MCYHFFAIAMPMTTPSVRAAATPASVLMGGIMPGAFGQEAGSQPHLPVPHPHEPLSQVHDGPQGQEEPFLASHLVGSQPHLPSAQPHDPSLHAQSGPQLHTAMANSLHV